MHHKAILNTWKEIAQYVGRSVRTIQRWERELGFPIHRPRGKHRSAVIAMPPEIDEWARRTPSANLAVRSSNVTVIDRERRQEPPDGKPATSQASEDDPEDEAHRRLPKLRAGR